MLHTEEAKPIQSEQRNEVCVTTLLTNKSTVDIFNLFSSLTKLKRIMAYCLRFVHNTRYPQQKFTEWLSTKELQITLHCLISIAQKQVFYEDIKALKKKQQISAHSKLISLHPFLEDNKQYYYSKVNRNCRY